MNKNKIYNEKTVHSFRELVSYCATNYGDRTAFTIKDSNKNLHDISFIEFENNIKELGSALLDLGLEKIDMSGVAVTLQFLHLIMW